MSLRHPHILDFLGAAMLRHGAKDARVVQTKCHCRGDDVCTFELTWR